MNPLIETSFQGHSGVRDLTDPRFEPLASGPFILQSTERRFDGASIERLRVRAARYRNTGERDTRDAMECVFIESGSTSVTTDGRTQLLTPSHVGFVPTWSDFTGAVSEEASILVIRIDRSTLMGMVPRFPTAPNVVPVREGLITSVRVFAASVLEVRAKLSAVESYALGQLLTEMVGSMLLDHFGVGTGVQSQTPSADLRDQAIAVIAQRCADPELDLEEIAASVLASPRRLQAAFSEADTTISAEVRRQRVALAVHLLTTRRYDVLGIDVIARDSGFGSTLSLRRALKDLYGATPSEIRRGHLPEAVGASDDSRVT